MTEYYLDNFSEALSSTSWMPTTVVAPLVAVVTFVALLLKLYCNDVLEKKHQREAVVRHELSVEATKVHLIVVIHGWNNKIRDVRKILAAIEKEIQYQQGGDKKLQKKTQFLIHASRANLGLTNDGIEAGGTRLAEEVCHVIQDLRRQQQQQDNGKDTKRQIELSLSFVGWSLGGMYARHALRQIHQEVSMLPKDEMTIDFRVFCSYAAPNLGQQGLTYVPLPRIVTYVMSHFMGATFRDLFRFNNLVEQMATEPQFLEPLQSFSKRIAYANAFWSDFYVTTRTAAFLTQNNDSIHHTIDFENKKETESTVTCVSTPFVIALSVETPNKCKEVCSNKFLIDSCPNSPSATTISSNSSYSSDNSSEVDKNEQQEENIDEGDDPNEENYNHVYDDNNRTHKSHEDLVLDKMAQNLDDMGWTKVFCDLRSRCPSRRIPWRNASSSSTLPQKEVWKSSELYSDTCKVSNRFYVPLAHTIIAANYQTVKTAHLNPDGHLILKNFAHKLINAITQAE